MSHGISYFYHYVLRGEYRKAEVSKLMGAPYNRVILMHIAIIAAAAPCILLGSPLPLLVILVVAKVLIDVMMHMKSHNQTDQPFYQAVIRRLRRFRSSSNA